MSIVQNEKKTTKKQKDMTAMAVTRFSLINTMYVQF